MPNKMFCDTCGSRLETTGMICPNHCGQIPVISAPPEDFVTLNIDKIKTKLFDLGTTSKEADKTCAVAIMQIDMLLNEVENLKIKLNPSIWNSDLVQAWFKDSNQDLYDHFIAIRDLPLVLSKEHEEFIKNRAESLKDISQMFGIPKEYLK